MQPMGLVRGVHVTGLQGIESGQPMQPCLRGCQEIVLACVHEGLGFKLQPRNNQFPENPFSSMTVVVWACLLPRVSVTACVRCARA